jgi:hypothetical protein
VKMELRDFAPVDPSTVSRDGFVFSRIESSPPKVSLAVQHAIKIVQILESSEDGSMRRVDMERSLREITSKQFDIGFKVCTNREWIAKSSISAEYSIAPKGNEMLYELKHGNDPVDTEGARIVGKLNGKCRRVYEE